MNRRQFIGTSALTFVGLHRFLEAAPAAGNTISPYGPLVPDPKGLLDLPKGFSYRVLSETGKTMSDGFKVPGQPDGMGAFPQADGKVVIICNHELALTRAKLGPFPETGKFPENLDASLAFNSGDDLKNPEVGGTTTLLYNPKTGEVETQFLSLIGTNTNCAGGVMPWGSWITCEETGDLVKGRYKKHGYCFEVKADPKSGLQKAKPLKALGRFRHEAVALDPVTRYLYLTEDRGDGLLYRFIPDKKDDLSSGQLQALKLKDQPKLDIRNYLASAEQMKTGVPLAIEWVDLDNVEAPDDDLRRRGRAMGAAYFARGEGIIYSKGALYLCCTNGGLARQGQIFRLTPKHDAKGTETLELYLQPEESDLLTNGDNICEGPSEHLFVCEDLIPEHKTKTPHLRGITPEGKIYTLARNAQNKSEFTGSCWEEKSRTMFVNLQTPGHTLAITGPWV